MLFFSFWQMVLPEKLSNCPESNCFARLRGGGQSINQSHLMGAVSDDHCRRTSNIIKFIDKNTMKLTKMSIAN